MRSKKAGTPYLSAATAKRRVAVKSSACGSPCISPITAPSAAHFNPSAMAHNASHPSFAVTWTMSRPAASGSPCRNIRPVSRIAFLSCTQSSGATVAAISPEVSPLVSALVSGVSNWASAKPIAATSPGAANTSCNVGSTGVSPPAGTCSVEGEGVENRHRFLTIRESPVLFMFYFLLPRNGYLTSRTGQARAAANRLYSQLYSFPNPTRGTAAHVVSLRKKRLMPPSRYHRLICR